ncbi:MAG TPA: hypothetical protein VMK53_10760 [Gemmatimonadales bacterium]|nr:hypothetical protein [Gemmatimonadales bacterium]
MYRLALAALLGLVTACGPETQDTTTPEVTPSSDHLFVWTAGADSTQPDYLAVLNVQPEDERYGSLVATLPVPGVGNGPHHTEHEMAEGGLLLANGFATGQTYIFDLNTPKAPQLVAQVGELDGYSHPHSYIRLGNGNVLAAFQMRHDSAGAMPGGLVEMTTRGELIRSSSAFGPDVPRAARTYSLAVVPALDRVISTTTDMDHENPHLSREIQVWRLSDLSLLHTFQLPPGPRGDEADFTAEPRVLADGRTVVVTTFSCGLYLLDGLDGDTPSGRLVASFPRSEDTWCAIPVVSGRHLMITVPSYPAVVSLDMTDPAAPREVGRVTLPEGWVPHWLALEPNTERLVLTGYGAMMNRVVLLTHDSTTGALAIDARFREEGATAPGIRLAGVPHGAVFHRK